jgi:hypothetical protein
MLPLDGLGVDAAPGSVRSRSPGGPPNGVPRTPVGNQTSSDVPTWLPFEFALRQGFDAFEWFSDRGRACWCEAETGASAIRCSLDFGADVAAKVVVHLFLDRGVQALWRWVFCDSVVLEPWPWRRSCWSRRGTGCGGCGTLWRPSKGSEQARETARSSSGSMPVAKPGPIEVTTNTRSRMRRAIGRRRPRAPR